MNIFLRFIRGGIQLVFNILFRCIFRTRLNGRERVPCEGGLLLVSNHISFVDPVLLGVVTPRPVEFMAMIELFRQPVLAVFARALGAFPVDRSRPDHAAVREAVRRLRDGHCLGMFPEGGIRLSTQSILGGEPVFRPGAGMIALLGQAAILPVIVRDTRKPYHWRNWLPWHSGKCCRATMSVTYGHPFCLWMPSHLPLAERRRWARETIRTELLKTVALE